MEEKIILINQIKVLRSENYYLKEKNREKEKRIRFLERELKKMELKIPHKFSEIQLGLDNFV